MFLDVLTLYYIRAERLFFLIQSLETRGRNVCDANEWEKKTYRNNMAFTSAWPPGVSVFLHFVHFKHPLCQSLPKEDTLSAETQEQQKSTSNSFLFVVRIFFIGSANNFSTDTIVSDKNQN